jgi:hypothetical protein
MANHASQDGRNCRWNDTGCHGSSTALGSYGIRTLAVREPRAGDQKLEPSEPVISQRLAKEHHVNSQFCPITVCTELEEYDNNEDYELTTRKEIKTTINDE